MSQPSTLGDETINGLLSQAMAAFAGGDGPVAATEVAPVATSERVDAGVDDRICAAAMRCIARRGLRKTTLDDVATEAGCSRATIYRAFPGGKDVVMAAAARREADTVLAKLALDLAAASNLDDTLTVAVHGAARALVGHAALGYVMEHEPAVVLPHLSFEGLDPLLGRAVEFLAPFLARFLDATEARRTAEWLARLVVLYTESPAPFDLTDVGDVRRLIDLHVLPGLAAATHQEQTS
jgi:AcrR family transcriptional regulator